MSDAVFGDFNGDNMPDFATCNRGTDNLAVWLALTPQTDAERVLYPCGKKPMSPHAADFDGDGRLEAITDPATAPANSQYRLEATTTTP